MWKALMCSAALALAAGSEEPPPSSTEPTAKEAASGETEEEREKMFHALGTKIGAVAAELSPSPEELELIKAGLSARLGEGWQQELAAEKAAAAAARLVELRKERVAARAARERKEGREVPEAAEEDAQAQRQDAPTRPQPAEEPLPPAVYYQVTFPEDAPSLGPKEAPVTVVAWVRPTAWKQVTALREAQRRHAAQMRLVLRFTTSFDHDLMLWKSEILLAANEQGRFWDGFRRLMANLNDERIFSDAEALGLDMERFREVMGLRLFQARALEDPAALTALGAAPPYGGIAFLAVNGRQHSVSLKGFDRVFEEEKARAERLLAEGGSPQQLYGRLIEGGRAPRPVPAPPAAPKLFDLSHSPTRGPATAPVTLLYFADFISSESADLVALLRALEQEYAGKVRVVFKHWSYRKDPPARLITLAALAAHEQGRFWDYHDWLLGQQMLLDHGRFALPDHGRLVLRARELGLDVARFKEDLGSGRLEPRLAADQAEGDWLHLKYAPVCFVNRQKVDGVLSLERFRKLIDRELEKAKAGNDPAGR